VLANLSLHRAVVDGLSVLFRIRQLHRQGLTLCMSKIDLDRVPALVLTQSRIEDDCGGPDLAPLIRKGCDTCLKNQGGCWVVVMSLGGNHLDRAVHSDRGCEREELAVGRELVFGEGEKSPRSPSRSSCAC
jgi:hypothetical protein